MKNNRARLLTATIAALLLHAASAEAGTFAVSNPIYDLQVTYGFEGDRVWHEVELTNKLEIEVTFMNVDAILQCAAGTRQPRAISVPQRDFASGETRRFRAEGTGCSPGEKREKGTGRLVEFHDEIRGVDFSGRVAMAQDGANTTGLTWDCGDQEIVVTAIKFPQGTGFRLLASNDRSMTSTSEFDAQAAAQHLCGGPVEDVDAVTSGIRQLIRQVRQICTKAPQFCDSIYDANNKRSAGIGVRG